MAHPRAALVREAAARLGTSIVRTPLLEAPSLNRLASARLDKKDLRVLVKAECLQKTGAFKFRGALNRLLEEDMDDAAARARGVVAFSSGNFAQALALAAATTGTKCTIVSPHDAPPLKLERTRDYGATVVVSTAAPGVNREVAASGMAAAFAEEHGAKLLHPFDDWPVIAGQGTLALEIFEEEEDVASLIVPTGGGGMLAGCCLAAELASPSTKLFCVEPAGYDDHRSSFESGARTPLAGAPAATISDALQASAPGELRWAVNGPRVAGAAAVPDADAVDAMAVAFTELKLVLEPSGALGLAALLRGDVPVADGDTVAVVACGGNVALDTFLELHAKR